MATPRAESRFAIVGQTLILVSLLPPNRPDRRLGGLGRSG
jgi:hypothetical protein